MLRAPSEAAARATSIIAPGRNKVLADELPEEEDEELSVDQAINLVVNDNFEQSVFAIKHVEAFIQEEEPQLISYVDQIAIVLSKQMQKAFSLDPSDLGNERLRKHLLVADISLFDKDRVWEDGRTLGSYLSRAALIPLLTVLVQQLIQSSFRAEDPSAQNESKYLNIILLRCFSACSLNLLYGACLQMLSEATEDLRELEGDVLETRYEFAKLLIKCLWKIAKRLEDDLSQRKVEPQQLFVDIESFLQTIEPFEWRQRAEDGVPLADVPLRTVKIILSSVVNHFGEEALGMLDMIPQPENSYVYKYLVRMLNFAFGDGGVDEEGDAVGSNAGAGANAPSQAVNAADTVDGAQQNSQNGHAADAAVDEESSIRLAELHAELHEIFKRISDKKLSRQGLQEMYEFRKRYPYLESYIQSLLQTTGPMFQRYIKRVFANYAAEDPDVINAAQPPPVWVADHNRRVSTSCATTTTGAPATPTSSRLSTPTVQADNCTASPSSSTHSPRSSSVRSSATDDRLAQLRAKFS